MHPAAFQKLAADAGVELFLPAQVVKANDFLVDYLFNIVTRRVEKGATLALLGFAYKPGTHITECSQSLMLMERFLEAGYRVSAHDPTAEIKIEPRCTHSVTIHTDPMKAITGAAAALLLVPWPIYCALDWKAVWKGLTHPIYFFDCWRVIKNVAHDKVKYWAFGG